jgi:acyl-[acyl-carrier-protein]-phospholipid O-acyltransferase / long-chain-fatty-acid--[acyl-carrier-protein] ligase
MSLPDVNEPGNRQVGHKAGSIGQPLPGVAARVVHPETLEDLAVGEEGLLLIRGANVMKGYLGEPERTAEVMRGAWYITGDIARFDADGFLTLTDRLSRFAKIAGEMVPLGAVEEAIQAMLDDQADNGGEQCAVTSIPDERRGERIVVLHTSPGLDGAALAQSLAAGGLPNLWIPARDAFHHVSDIPVLGTGKMDLRAIREMAVSLEKSQA